MKSHPSILITEDEGIVARDLESRLLNLGYEVAGVAASGEEAILKAHHSHPDLALMDIRLKGKMDGVQAAAHLREKLNIPVVYLTSYTDSTTVDRAGQTQPMGYLVKPFNARELDITIQLALKRHRSDLALQDHDQHLSHVFDGLFDAVIVTNQRGRVSFMNQSPAHLTGFSPAEGAGKPIHQILHFVEEPAFPVLSNGGVAGMRKLNPHGHAIYCMLLNRTGEKIAVDVRMSLLKQGSRNHRGDMVILIRDISKQHQTEMQLRASEERLMLAVDYCQGGVWDLDLLHQKLHVSQGWKQLMGLSHHHGNQFEPKMLGGTVSIDDQERFSKALLDHWDGLTPFFSLVHHVCLPGGRGKQVLSRGVAVKNNAGQLVRMVGATFEIEDEFRAMKAASRGNLPETPSPHSEGSPYRYVEGL
jgi:PAS domain S-box-containing protein